VAKVGGTIIGVAAIFLELGNIYMTANEVDKKQIIIGIKKVLKDLKEVNEDLKKEVKAYEFFY
jgi:hypothetical protein